MTGKSDNARLFLLWMMVGAGSCLAVVSLLTIGIFVLPFALLGGALLLWRSGATRHLAGALSGAGAIPLYVAWLNRGGPGEVCTGTSAHGEHCVSAWSPWPWLAVGVVLLAAGVLLFASLRPRQGHVGSLAD